MIDIIDNELIISFPDVHKKAVCYIHFEHIGYMDQHLSFLDGKNFPMTVSKGNVPLSQALNGIQLESDNQDELFIRIKGSYPIAIEITQCVRNKLPMKEWNGSGTQLESLDYLVSGRQPWMDSHLLRKHEIRQLIQKLHDTRIVAYPMKAEVYEEIMPKNSPLGLLSMRDHDVKCFDLDSWDIASVSSSSLIFSF